LPGVIHRRGPRIAGPVAPYSITVREPIRGNARMPPETEVITCPACRHLLRVPADWLGQTVQCPECKATFRAPVRDGDRLTEPELISRPAPAAAPAAARKPDVMLLLPAFGLLFVGFAGLVVN